MRLCSLRAPPEARRHPEAERMPAPMPPGGGQDPNRGDERQRRRMPPDEPKKRFRIPIWYVLAGLGLLFLIHWASGSYGRKEIKYGEFRRLLGEDRIHSVVLRPNEVQGELVEVGPDGKRQNFVAPRPTGDDEIYGLLHDHVVDKDWDVRTDRLQNFLLFWILPIGLIILLWKFLFSRMSPASSMMEFSQSRAKMVAQKDIDVSFDDVAGVDESKEELQEVIEFLKSPTKFTRLGGKIPKGVLLLGPPGTGKTLLAKAVAGEAAVPFFSLSGSDFVEMFVGVGAARVRDLFEQANKQAPCIIFIDELDALGKARGVGMMGGHDEREQTLNALLVHMDGFQSAKGVILLAATNRPEMLDPALLRPGRFDRHIMVPRPDLNGREKILAVHVRDLQLNENINLKKLAAITPGFVGADLANLANEGALLAARRGKDRVEMQDFEDAVERVVAGLEKRSRIMNEEEKKTVAYHESGHALVACLLPGADPVRKVSVIPRGFAALGYTMQFPTEDRYLLKKSELLDRLTVMLGGRSAEEIVFAEVSTGAQNDLQRATELARQMVVEYGMSEELGLMTFTENPAQFPFDGFSVHHQWSERTSQEIDKAVRVFIDNAHQRCRRLLETHKQALAKLASALMEKEAVEQAELNQILVEFGIETSKAAPAKNESTSAGAGPDSAGPVEEPLADEEDAFEPQEAMGGHEQEASSE